MEMLSLYAKIAPIIEVDAVSKEICLGVRILCGDWSMILDYVAGVIHSLNWIYFELWRQSTLFSLLIRFKESLSRPLGPRATILQLLPGPLRAGTVQFKINNTSSPF